MSRAVRNLARSVLAAGCVAGAVAVAAPPASAATYSGNYQGPCAQAAGSSAYRTQVKIPVTELNVPLVNIFNQQVGQFNATTAYMTMNVEWCTNFSRVTYATIATSNADRTTGGAASNLERKSYQKAGTPPTAVGGPYTLVTTASWGRNGDFKISASPFNVGGEASFGLANFTSTMTVKVYPNAQVECTGTSGGNAEPCNENW
ncbi:hypothetical protein [Micromonospora mirobrigensis]|uniref:Secreted protein n=1 Tax=Micromonospora mirobrigensis TaxID=262898 RepID=A0A1C4ZYI5_9ACTN|nr:hypothetical protein [Micromonospora mirobrigensis]SCF38027.1 hypothetical protein GA0070564_10740 [Micromonospora mirobrigensis]